MPTVLLYVTPPTEPCTNPDHKAPDKSTLTQGLWVHTCPKCGWVTTIHVKGDDEL